MYNVVNTSEPTTPWSTKLDLIQDLEHCQELLFEWEFSFFLFEG